MECIAQVLQGKTKMMNVMLLNGVTWLAASWPPRRRRHLRRRHETSFQRPRSHLQQDCRNSGGGGWLRPGPRRPCPATARTR